MAAVKVLAPPLDAISRDARAYPVHLLRERETGLCLFAAAFLGVNDAVHMARMGMTTTCVDVDRNQLDRMRGLYPADWTFINTDAFLWARTVKQGGPSYDVVSVDTWTGDLMERSLASLELWCSLARRVVTATVTKDATYTVPDGWEASISERSDLADWLVLTRA